MNVIYNSCVIELLTKQLKGAKAFGKRTIGRKP